MTHRTRKRKSPEEAPKPCGVGNSWRTAQARFQQRKHKKREHKTEAKAPLSKDRDAWKCPDCGEWIHGKIEKCPRCQGSKPTTEKVKVQVEVP